MPNAGTRIQAFISPAVILSAAKNLFLPHSDRDSSLRSE